MPHDGQVTAPAPRRSLVSRLLGREPDPHRPLDHDYVQTRWVRLYRPGPWRVAVLVPAALVLAFAASIVLVAVLAVRVHPVLHLGTLLVAALVLAGLGLLLTRAMTSGVYVNDQGVRVVSLRRSRVMRWDEVVDVRRVAGPQAVFGLPMVRQDGERVLLILRGGSDVPTPVATGAADFAGRAEAYDIAASALERWWQAGRA